jgi:GxxExxY protein
MEVHRELGKGYGEVIDKDALEIEFNRQEVLFARERDFILTYKNTVLPHKYFADFVVMDKIILEAKAIECLTDSHIKQTLNYLAASKLKLGLLVNFGGDSLSFKRVVL